MSPPKSIKILHLEWDLIFVDPTITEQAQAYGWTNKVLQKIYIQSNLRPRCMAETITHELYHGIFSSCGIPDEITEEQAASMLSGPLLLVILENPELVAWLKHLLTPLEDVDDSAYQ